MASDATVVQILKSHGLKKTKVRIKMLNILMAAEKPVTQAEFLKTIGSPSTHRASLYRNLVQFRKLGIVYEIEQNRYLYCLSDHNKNLRIFLYCPICNSQQENQDEGVTRKISLSLKKIGFLASDGQVTLRGLCHKCAANEGGQTQII